MPRRGKASKACQTDTVYLSEDQVETIISKRITHYDDHITKLQKEIEDLKSTVGLLVSGTDALNNLQQRSEVDIEQLQGIVETIEENQDKTSTEVNKKFEESEETLKSIEDRIDDLEQENKANNIRVFGMEEQEDEDLKTKVITLVKNRLQVHIETDDIKDIGRMGKKRDKVRDILIKFRSKTLRNKIYNRKKLLKQDKTDNMIFINEDLTNNRSKLFFEARKLRRREKIFGTWTQAGNIMVKVKESDQPCAVKRYHELAKLVQNEDPAEIE